MPDALIYSVHKVSNACCADWIEVASDKDFIASSTVDVSMFLPASSNLPNASINPSKDDKSTLPSETIFAIASSRSDKSSCKSESSVIVSEKEVAPMPSPLFATDSCAFFTSCKAIS